MEYFIRKGIIAETEDSERTPYHRRTGTSVARKGLSPFRISITMEETGMTTLIRRRQASTRILVGTTGYPGRMCL